MKEYRRLPNHSVVVQTSEVPDSQDIVSDKGSVGPKVRRIGANAEVSTED